MKPVKNPFIIFFPPFALGILFSILINIQIPYLSGIIAVFLLILFIINKLNKQLLFGVFAYFFLFLLGNYFTQLHKPIPPQNTPKQKVFYEGIIVEPPKEKRKTIQTIVELKIYRDSTKWQYFDTKALVNFQKNHISSAFKYGDKVIFKSYLNEIKNAGNPAEFNYKAFMQNKGVFMNAFVKNTEFMILEHNQGNWFIRKALDLRQKMLEIYQQNGFQDQEYAVLSALSLGYRDEIDNETRQIFANTGAMHILAVSGLHVGIIYLILTTLLKFMDKKRWLKILQGIIIIVSLWFFATIAGLSPSVTRSALMFSLFVIGRLLQRTTSTYNIIFASAFILLSLNPLDILSVGFQLSYSAVLAIVFFQPHIYKIFKFKRILPDKIWALTSVSIAAQIGTMPISIYYFHQFPNYFFITNIFVIPLASIILYLAVLLLVLNYTLTFASAFSAYILKLSLKGLLTIVELINRIPFSTTTDIFISSSQTIILYIIILSFSFFWIKNNIKFLYTFLITSIIFLIFNFNIKYQNKTSNELLIFNTYKQLTISIFNGKTNYIITDTTQKYSLNYLTKPYAIKKQISTSQITDLQNLITNNKTSKLFNFKNDFFTVGNTKFLLLQNDKLTKNKTNNKLKLDYIILSNNIYIDIKELTNLFDFKEIIFAGNNKIWRTNKWTEQCEELGIPYYNMLEKGAFLIDFKSKKHIEI